MNDDLQKQVNQGADAAQILENPAWHEMFRRMESKLEQEWLNIDLRDTEGQRLLLQGRKLLARMKQTMTGMVEQGKMASAKLPIDDLRGENVVRRGLRQMANR